MVHLKAAIFILSLVFLEIANGWPIRFANLQENDKNTEVSLNDIEKQGSDVPLVRLKRVSDQRLAELQTLYALSKINLMAANNRTTYNINPAVIGRRKRNASDLNAHEIRRIDQSSSESTIDEILIS